MKTKLFAKIVPSDDFSKTIKKLSELPPECLDDLVVWFNNLKVEPRRLDPGPMYPAETVKVLCNKHSIQTDEFWEIINIIFYITRGVHRDHDDIHDIVSDMNSVGLVSDSNVAKINDFFERVLQKGIEFAVQRRRSTHERGQLAGLSEINYNVDLRLIPDQGFDPTEMKIEDYKPKGSELIPVAILCVTIDDDEKKTPVSFQVNFGELEDIIVVLLACQKEMRLIQGLAQNIDFSQLNRQE